MMARKSPIAVLWALALLADVGMVFHSVRSMSHAARTMRSAVEIVGCRATAWVKMPCVHKAFHQVVGK
jgi:hypothetical protein